MDRVFSQRGQGAVSVADGISSHLNTCRVLLGDDREFSIQPGLDQPVIVYAGEVALDQPEGVGAIGRGKILQMGGDECVGLLGVQRGLEVAVDRHRCCGVLLAQIPVEGGKEEVGVDEGGGDGVRAVPLIGVDVVGGGAPVFAKERGGPENGQGCSEGGGQGRRGRSERRPPAASVQAR